MFCSRLRAQQSAYIANINFRMMIIIIIDTILKIEGHLVKAICYFNDRNGFPYTG